MPKPTVARTEGFCIGGGLELAMVCDLQFADDDALRWGLINRSAPANEIDELVETTLRTIAANAPLSVKAAI